MSAETLAQVIHNAVLVAPRGPTSRAVHAAVRAWFAARLDDDQTRTAVAAVLDESGWEQNPDDLSWARVYRPGPRTDAALAIVKTALGAAGPRIGARVDVPLRVVRPAGGGS